MIHCTRRCQAHQRGQSLVLIAIILTFLVPLILTSIEIGQRYLELARLEDALRQAARTAVQTVRYEPFAGNTLSLADEQRIRTIGRDALATNLTTSRRLHDGMTPDSTADLAQWTILPAGGTCWDTTLTEPAVCAEIVPVLDGLVFGYGEWRPRLRVTVDLDHIH